MNNRQDEKFVEDFLKSLTLKPTRFPKEEQRKAPDFKVETEDGFFFFCEVKTIETETSKEGILFSNIYNNFTSKISKASEQFKSVNSLKIVPNVLIFTSNNFQINYKFFEDLIKGKLEIDGEEISNFRKYRDGKIKYDLREEIDLFIFFEHTTPHYYCNNYAFRKRFSRIFKIDFNETITI